MRRGSQLDWNRDLREGMINHYLSFLTNFKIGGCSQFDCFISPYIIIFCRCTDCRCLTSFFYRKLALFKCSYLNLNETWRVIFDLSLIMRIYSSIFSSTYVVSLVNENVDFFFVCENTNYILFINIKINVKGDSILRFICITENLNLCRYV